jgi:hypothetical protein
MLKLRPLLSRLFFAKRHQKFFLSLEKNIFCTFCCSFGHFILKARLDRGYGLPVYLPVYGLPVYIMDHLY